MHSFLSLPSLARGSVTPDASGLILALSRQAQTLTEATSEEQEKQVVTKINTNKGYAGEMNVARCTWVRCTDPLILYPT